MSAKVRVMVFERDSGSREPLLRDLQDEGFHVTVQNSARDVLQQIKTEPVQIVLVDPAVPEVERDDLRSEIERANPDVSVILLLEAPPADSGDPAPADWRASLRDTILRKGLSTGREGRLNAAIGRRIRELRRERGLTLRQLAGRTGLSVSLISQIELAKSAASILTLYRLVTALGYDLSSFFTNMI